MRNFRKSVRLFCLIAVVFCAGTIMAADRAKEASPLARWTLDTADTRLVVGVSKDQQLCIYGISSPVHGWNWTASPSSLPLVNRTDSGGTKYDLKWTYLNGVVDKSDGDKLTIRFTNAVPAMELKSIWQARPGPGPIRHTMFVQNHTDQSVTLYEQETLDVRVTGPDTNTSVWYFNDDGSVPDKIGVYHETPSRGYQKTLPITEKQDFIPFVVVEANGAGGIYLGWEWSLGRLTIAADNATNGVRLKAGNRDDFRTDLSAGEIFEVPPGFIGAYTGDIDSAGNSLRKYLFHYSMPARLRNDPGFPKVEWNAFAPTGKGQGSWDPTETKYYPFIDDIAPLGFEEVVIDIGWWSSYGDPGHIVTDAVDWPSGMAAAAKYAHDRGLRFGLYDNEPEDLTSQSGKLERISDISYLISEFKADFYRSDGTAGPVIKGVHGQNQRAHYPEDVGYWATKGFYEVIDTLYANIPTFLWECCSGGGRIKDFGASKRAAKIQNQDRYYPIDARQSFYDTSYVFHPMQIAALDGSWKAWQASGSVFEFRASSMGAAYWHPDAPNGGNGGLVWSIEQKAAIKKAVTTYKTKIRPLVRNANLYHIFPRPNDVVWDGIEYYDPATIEGVVYIFKPKSTPDLQTVKLKGLNPANRYTLTFEDGSNPSATLDGAALMTTGVRVALKGTNVSELMFLKGTRP